MSPSGTKSSARKVLIHPNRLLSRLRATRRLENEGEEGERLVVGSSLIPLALDPPSSPRLRSSPIEDLDSVTLAYRYPRMVPQLLQSLPSPYPLLNPNGVELTDKHPIAAGGFTDIWGANYDGRRVVLKSYRQYVSFDVAQAVTVCRGRRWRTSC